MTEDTQMLRAMYKPTTSINMAISRHDTVRTTKTPLIGRIAKIAEPETLTMMIAILKKKDSLEQSSWVAGRCCWRGCAARLRSPPPPLAAVCAPCAGCAQRCLQTESHRHTADGRATERRVPSGRHAGS